MTVFWPYFLVFVLSAVPMVEAIVMIPVGIFAGLSTSLVTVLAFMGNVLTLLLAILFIDRLKGWWARRKGGTAPSKRQQRAKHLWNKYGLPGFSILGPLLVGTHLTAVMGMAFGATQKQMTIWILLSLATWTIAVAVLSHYGVVFFQMKDNGGLLYDLLKK
jgi:hypothetical protein